jgi:putative membrane protein
MKKMFALAVVATCVAGGPAFAATDAECQDMWRKADANSDGSVSGNEAIRYMSFMRVAGMTVTIEGTITQAEFMNACRADAYKPKRADAGAPLKGSNSFTEAQARDRIIAQGMDNVTGLAKDGDGIWRGTAQQAGKSVEVAVDYKGNVVTANQ